MPYNTLYRLDYDKLIGLTKIYTQNDQTRTIAFREKTVENILSAIDKSKQQTFEKVLFAIGIRYVGETSAKKIAKHFGNIDNLKQASLEQLMEVEDVGEKVAQSVIQYLADDHNWQIIQDLRAFGVQMSCRQTQEILSEKLQGLTFVVSGSFDTPDRRKEIEEMIELHGGKKVDSVSKKVNYIIAGANMGPSKLSKARDLGIPIITEQDFLKML